jgi:ABC-type multidrug transport system fused ATPase/permease subunit
MTSTILLPDSAHMPVSSVSLWPWLGFFLKPYWKTFFIFLLFRVARYTVILMVPFMIGYTINAFETGEAFREPVQLAWFIGGFMALYGIALASMILFTNEAKAEDRLVRSMTLFSVRHMNALPLPWHEAQGSGGKLQRVMTARTSLKQMYNIYKWTAVPFTAGILSIILSIVMIDAPWFFFLLYGGFIVTFFVTGLYMARKIPEYHNRHNIVLEKLMAGVYEFVSAVRTVKAFHMAHYIDREAQRLESDGHRAMTTIFKATYLKWTVLNMLGFFWLSAFVLSCAAGIYQGWLSTGAFATIFFMAQALWHRLEEIIFMQDEFLQARNGFMRLTETLKAPQISYDHAPLQPLNNDWKKLSFDEIDFSYAGNAENEGKAPPALHGVSLQLGRGEKIALVGRSGAGKSTFIKLLMKQVEPTTGQITIDETDLRHIATADWLGRIGFVPQDVELFNMNIRDNILLDRGYDGNEEAYRTALRHAALDQLIETLPQGDETMVGERGIKLSGGQRQRLGIARALVRNADLIIFDEATASLDSLSEQVIQNALTTAFADKTMVIIAHRLSTVRFADRIIVMENGRVVEEGRFDDLIALKGKFATMWALQSSGFVDGEPERECVDSAA